MLPVSRHGSRCIHCALRVRQLTLRLQRAKSTTAANADPQRIRYTAGDATYTGRRVRARESRYGVFAGDRNGVPVRRMLNSRLDGPDKIGKPNIRIDWSAVLRTRLSAMRQELQDAPVLEFLRTEATEDGKKKPKKFSQLWREFEATLVPAAGVKMPFLQPREGETDGESLVKDLRRAHKERGNGGLDERIKYHFYAHVTGARFSDSDINNQKALADLRYPAEWYPGTRQMQRTIHLHVGPTNSGKTYQALKRLEEADVGLYAGPLRLLAHEVYSRMNAKGRPCSLITGEERRVPKTVTTEWKEGTRVLSSCTVEMVPLNHTFDVAVIDEIQMIGSSERGWAWTQAMLGVKAKEVHLCGEERTVPLITAMCAAVGEKLEVHRYQRLSPLKMADVSLNGNLKNLRKGDCVVSFSVIGIHALRKQIEKITGKKVATVYGSLPPETRAQQARLFNDPNNDYDYLVASDAVGMGLNLAIKRVIFESSTKWNGYSRQTLDIADIKQIGGRAGRYRVAPSAPVDEEANEALAAAKGDINPVEAPPPPSVESEETLGLVTTLEKFDYPVVAAGMQADPQPLRSAGLFPPFPTVERFASYFPPGTPFSYIITRLHELSQVHSRYHLCGLKDHTWIADLIEPITSLTISDRNIMCASPAAKRDIDMWRKLMPKFATCVAEQSGGGLHEIEEMPLEILDQKPSASRQYLGELEQLHKGIVTYLWLSYRFAGIFTTRALALHAKSLVEDKIEEVLAKFSFSEAQRRRLAAKREALIAAQAEKLFGDRSESAVQDPQTDEHVTIPQEALDDDDLENDEEEEDEEQENDEDKDDLEDDDNEPPDVRTRPDSVLYSQKQTGEHFSTEADMTYAEPDELDAAEETGETDPPAPSFSAWRAQQTRGESQGSREDADNMGFTPAKEEVEEALTDSSRSAAEESQGEEQTQLQPPQSSSRGERVSTPLDNESVDEHSSNTVGQPPQPESFRSDAATTEATTDKAASRRSSGQIPLSTVPSKHIHQLDVPVPEVERSIESRP